ncbi:MAG TPA: hypothetical protein VJA47_03770 [archaeon]|nr:hypothetical protein [archaeon]
MVNDQGFFERSPLEVEYRTPGILLEVISNRLGTQISIPKSVYIVDSYIYFDRKTGDFKRVRKVGVSEDGDQPTDFRYQEQWKLHPFGEHPIEMKRKLAEGQYLDCLGNGQIAAVVEGLRREVWITEDGYRTDKTEDGLHICFDSPKDLGDWTEFEIEIYGFNRLSDQERANRKEETKKRILDFTSSIGLTELALNHPTYVEQILRRRRSTTF